VRLAVRVQGHAFPVLRPARAVLIRVPLGLRPWLHRLRCGSRRFVRRLHSYYDGVRFLGLVHQRRRLLAFPLRTGGVLPPGDPETSRFPCKELPHMPGSLTTPERQVLALSHRPVLPSVLSSTSASGLGLSRLNGWPMRSPVDASPTPSRVLTHDSGASVVRYTFTARDFHFLLFAGFADALITSFVMQDFGRHVVIS
jgi:hypothetical protein